MIKFISLSSGSNGNCYYLGNDETALLIDVGIGGRTIKKRLEDNGLSISSVKMILVTHNHIDHIKYLGSVAERLSVPVYAPAGIHNVLEHHPCTKGQIRGCKRVIRKETFTQCGEVKFASFDVPHDAVETVGYYIDFYGENFVFMTDLGDVPDSALEYCRMANHLIIESNFDLDMLIRGNYSPELKKRIYEGNGHLSNDQCAHALKMIMHPELQSVYLCHLSENNNSPQLAYECASEAISSTGRVLGKDIKLFCLPRKEASPLFTF